MNEELLKNIYWYQLSWWHRKVYDYFIKKVYPKIKRSHIAHLELIDKKLIGHPLGYNCTTCKYRTLLLPPSPRIND